MKTLVAMFALFLSFSASALEPPVIKIGAGYQHKVVTETNEGAVTNYVAAVPLTFYHNNQFSSWQIMRMFNPHKPAENSISLPPQTVLGVNGLIYGQVTYYLNLEKVQLPNLVLKANYKLDLVVTDAIAKTDQVKPNPLE